MGGLDRFRGETINQIEYLGFLIFQTEPNHLCARTEPNWKEPVQFGSVTCFCFLLFKKKWQFNWWETLDFK